MKHNFFGFFFCACEFWSCFRNVIPVRPLFFPTGEFIFLLINAGKIPDIKKKTKDGTKKRRTNEENAIRNQKCGGRMREKTRILGYYLSLPYPGKNKIVCTYTLFPIFMSTFTLIQYHVVIFYLLLVPCFSVTKFLVPGSLLFL